jgi:hypothetical protein
MRLALAVALASTFAASAGASVVVSFRTPSGNIGCTFASGLVGASANLRCDIRGGLKPMPPKPRSCDLDWGFGYSMSSTGRAHAVCAGDTALIPSSRVLRYGSRWSRGGFTCKSRVTGLRCVNRSRHGFFLSRAHSFRF